MAELVATAGLHDIVEALKQPEIYPSQPESVEFIETHASAVFIAGADVYKLKKQVDFGFLDYSTLPQRRLMCHLEVQFNRRLAPDVYLGVEELVQDGERVSLGGRGDVVDYLVHMRRLPDDATLASLVDRDAVSHRDIDRIARRIATFHQRALRGPEVDRWGLPAAIEQNVEENFEQVQPYLGRSIPVATFERIVHYAREFLVEQRGLLNQRVLDGLTRDGHGDIRADHVYLLDEVTIVDCIEFNDRLRYGDVATDVGFLAMDLDARNRPDLSDRLISSYTAASGFDVEPVLDFFRCYRAFVRGKVASFRLEQEGLDDAGRSDVRREARRYFHLAHRYAAADRGSRLILMNGLTGTGKSTLARALAGVLPAEVIDSDSTRKRLAGLSPTERDPSGYGEGIYSAAMTEKVYRELLVRAGKLLARGQTVILDATYTGRADRQQARELAQEFGAEFLIAQCEVAEDVARSRLLTRVDDPASVSDGRWEIYLAQRDTADPLDRAEEPVTRRIDTGRPMDSQVESLLLRLEHAL